MPLAGRKPGDVAASPAQRAELEAARAAARERRQAIAAVVSASGSSPTAQPAGAAGPSRKGADYVDFRIAEGRDTRGGFMAEEARPDDGPGGKRRRADTASRREPVLVIDPPIHMPLESNPLCEVCGTPVIDANYYRWYNVRVCSTCRVAGGDTYRMITKGEAKEDFLVTDSELEKLRCVQRPNPHNANWKDMKLYLYKQVYEYAIQKWGSEDKLNAAFVGRTEQKPKRRKTGAAFAKSVDELERADRAAVVVNKLVAVHTHDYGPSFLDEADQQWKQRCECGFWVAIEPVL